jgi:hypothetical protein
MANTGNKTKLDYADVCSLMHTALRKCCDSKITSAAYNLVHTIDIKPEMWDPWRLLGKIVARRMNESGNKPVEALKIGIEHLDDQWQEIAAREWEAHREPPDNARSTMSVLACILKCFDESDLEGMVSYLDD